MWIPGTEGPHSQGAQRSRKTCTAFSSPNCAHSLFQSHWSIQQGDNSGYITALYSCSSCRFTSARHPHTAEKMPGLFFLFVTGKNNIAGKIVWFRIPSPYILASNLALKSQWEDQILLWKSTSALPEVISVSLTCMLRWKRQQLCSEHDHSGVNEDEEKGRRKRLQRHSVTCWEKSPFE